MGFEMPTVSVIIPTYNRASCLGRSIRSVLSQSFSDFELIIVDDCSDDGTEQVVKLFSDSRIRYIKNPVNQGGAAARNLGIKAAKGRFVAFQDSDDVWFRDKLEKCMSTFSKENHETGVVFSSYIKWQDGILYWVPRFPLPEIIKAGDKRIIERNFVGTPTAVVRTGLLHQVGGFDPSMPRYQDWEMFIRLSALCNMRYIKRPLVHAYVSSDSISGSDRTHLLALLEIYKKNCDKIKADASLGLVWRMKIADAHMRNGDQQKARNHYLEAYCQNRGSFFIFLRLVTSWAFRGKKYRQTIDFVSKVRAYLLQRKIKRLLLSDGVDISIE